MADVARVINATDGNADNALGAALSISLRAARPAQPSSRAWTMDGSAMCPVLGSALMT